VSTYHVPEFTLGWGVLDWCSTWLAQPDGDEKGEPWCFTPEQARFILDFYAVDKYGVWLYRRGVLERPKGWGKSPLLAAICCCELLGPVKFSHFDDEDSPVGRPQPSSQVQIAAISEAQTDNTLSLVGEMLLDGPAAKHYRLDVLMSKVTAPGNRSLTRVTASPRSREGNRPTFVVMDETHLWLPVEKGPELAAVLRRNLAKTGGRSIETTNAAVPGQMSVAEQSWDYAQLIKAGKSFDDTLLFDSRQVIVESVYDKDAVMPALEYVYGDAAKTASNPRGFVHLDRIWAEINDPATTENDARRFYLNQRRQDEAQWIKDAQWAKAGRDDLVLKKTDPIALGFRGVTRNAAAALVACRLTDGALFLVGSWDKPSELANNVDWELPVKTVDARIRKYLAREQTKYLVADPRTLQDVIGRISLDFPDMVEEFWLQQKMKASKAIEMLESALLSDPPRATHPNDPELTWGVLNAYTQEVTEGHVLIKDRPESRKYIATAEAAVLAFYAAGVANGIDEGPTGIVYGWR
jgi:hypothetical protein